MNSGYALQWCWNLASLSFFTLRIQFLGNTVTYLIYFKTWIWGTYFMAVFFKALFFLEEFYVQGKIEGTEWKVEGTKQKHQKGLDPNV